MGITGEKGWSCSYTCGDGKDGLEPLNELAENSDFPLDMFVPTHLNETSPCLPGFGVCEKGGNIDFTAGQDTGTGILFGCTEGMY